MHQWYTMQQQQCCLLPMHQWYTMQQQLVLPPAHAPVVHHAATSGGPTSMLVNSGLWRVEMPSLRKIRPISNTRSNPPT